MLVGSIDLNKIEKQRIVTKDKNGNPFENGAKYYNVVVWVNDEPDQFGNDASIQTSVTKEEREGGQKGSYIGNLKSPTQQAQPTAIPQSQSSTVNEPDDLPF